MMVVAINGSAHPLANLRHMIFIKTCVSPKYGAGSWTIISAAVKWKWEVECLFERPL